MFQGSLNAKYTANMTRGCSLDTIWHILPLRFIRPLFAFSFIFFLLFLPLFCGTATASDNCDQDNADCTLIEEEKEVPDGFDEQPNTENMENLNGNTHAQRFVYSLFEYQILICCSSAL